ncbi:MAG TPA: flagellar biosynthesis anti-sigma factor FlgM [Dongiaceae bacterium]|nr:flagellar biosynthesis anti-sigma factor FlgM [Dongiaceae bacterium]
MRIDFNYGAHATPETSRTGMDNSGAQGYRVSGTQPAADQAQLSGAHVQVAALADQAGQLPEIRHERVHALREAVQSGRYQLDPEKVAVAMVRQMAIGPAA